MDAQSTTNGNNATATIGNDAATAGSNGGDPTQQAPPARATCSPGPRASSGVGVHVGHLLVAGPVDDGDRHGDRHRRGHLPARRVHLHRQHHVDRHRQLGRHHRQGHRLDAGAEHVDRRRADLHHRQRHPGAEQQVPRRAAHLRPQHAAQGARHHDRRHQPTDKVGGASASRELDGLQISINLNTLDTAANKFASLLPAKIISQLPVAIPNEQQITLYFGRVQVNSTASPNFVANSGSTGAGVRRSSHLDRRLERREHGQRLHGQHGQRRRQQLRRQHRERPRLVALGRQRYGLLTDRVPQTSTVGATFKGVGAALILLGLLAAAALAYLYNGRTTSPTPSAPRVRTGTRSWSASPSRPTN